MGCPVKPPTSYSMPSISTRASGRTERISVSSFTRSSNPIVAPFGVVEKVREIIPLERIISLFSLDLKTPAFSSGLLINQSFATPLIKDSFATGNT